MRKYEDFRFCTALEQSALTEKTFDLSQYTKFKSSAPNHRNKSDVKLRSLYSEQWVDFGNNKGGLRMKVRERVEKRSGNEKKEKIQ